MDAACARKEVRQDDLDQAKCDREGGCRAPRCAVEPGPSAARRRIPGAAPEPVPCAQWRMALAGQSVRGAQGGNLFAHPVADVPQVGLRVASGELPGRLNQLGCHQPVRPSTLRRRHGGPQTGHGVVYASDLPGLEAQAELGTAPEHVLGGAGPFGGGQELEFARMQPGAEVGA